MKRIFSAAVAMAAFASAQQAHAVDFIPGTVTPTAVFLVTSGDPMTGTDFVQAIYSRAANFVGTATDRFLFRIGPVGGDPIGLGAGDITTTFSGTAQSPIDLDFVIDEVIFNNGVADFIIPITTSGNTESGSLTDVTIYSGVLNSLSVTYRSRGQGSFGGNLNFAPVNGAIPEPGTWALMLAGFGAVGFAMRRRNKPQPKVRFAF